MEENTSFRAEFWSQLRATLIRNVLRKKRNKRHMMKVGEGEEKIFALLFLSFRKSLDRFI